MTTFRYTQSLYQSLYEIVKYWERSKERSIFYFLFLGRIPNPPTFEDILNFGSSNLKRIKYEV